MARLDSKKEPPGNTEFPIYKDIAVYVAKGVPRMAALSKAHQTLIERLQPYHAANVDADPLWTLNRLRNIDEHRTLHVAAAVMSHNSLGIVTLVGYDIHDLTVAPSTKAGTNIVSAKLVRTVPAHLTQLHMKHDIGVQIRLRDGLGDREVLRVLDEIRQFIRDHVVAQFEADFV